MSESRFYVIIPARLASTRLPNKPLADLGGKPMVVRTAERARMSGAAEIIVATDHPDIAAVCHEHGIDVALTRADHPSGTDRIAEVAATRDFPLDSVIVNVQGDEPMIAPELIAATAALVNSATPMATAAHPLHAIEDVFNPNVVKVILDHAGRAMYFSRAAIPWHRDAFARSTELMPGDTAGIAYRPLRHIGLYAYTRSFLQAYATLPVSPIEQIEALEQLRVLWNGHAIAVHVTEQVPAAGVDTPEDLLRMQALYSTQ